MISLTAIVTCKNAYTKAEFTNVHGFGLESIDYLLINSCFNIFKKSRFFSENTRAPVWATWPIKIEIKQAHRRADMDRLPYMFVAFLKISNDLFL